MPVEVSTIIAVVIGIVLFVLLLKLLRKPLKWVWKLLLNAVSGYIGLFFLNLLGGLVGLSLDLNLVNAIVVGILGLPGVGLLLVIKYLL